MGPAPLECLSPKLGPLVSEDIAGQNLLPSQARSHPGRAQLSSPGSLPTGFLQTSVPYSDISFLQAVEPKTALYPPPSL